MDRTTQLQEAFKLALSMVLFYWLALSMNWELPKYGALAIAVISLDTTGASLRKGVMRVIGTTFGLAIGLVAIASFVQDRWGAMAFFVIYILVLNYFMLGSRYAYAWNIAAVLPALIWAATYGNTDAAFGFAAFRYLETTAGVIIFTLVSALLWPRDAGDELIRQGIALWSDVRKLFGLYRLQLTNGISQAEAESLGAGLPGKIARMLETLDTAYADTSSVIAQKRRWEILRVNALTVRDALALWAQTLDDSRTLVLERAEFTRAMDTLDQRLGRISALWPAAVKADDASVADEDACLLQPVVLEPEGPSAATLSHYDQAVLASFRQQLIILDAASRELLGTLRTLVGLDPGREHRVSPMVLDRYRPSLWQSERIRKASFPALCFLVGYLFWILFDPPPGPIIPVMAVTFGMSVILSNITPQVLWKTLIVALVGMTLVAAPLNFLLLPMLSTSYELMTVIFVYVFAAGYIGARQPIAKLLLLQLLVVLNITNDQTYSFLGLANGMLMLYLVLGGIAVLLTLVAPSRPEQVLLRSVGRFFDGCVRIIGEFSLSRSEGIARASGRRKRYYESMILPASAQLQSLEKTLEYESYPENTPDKVRLMIDGMQSIAFRLEALDIAYMRLVSRSPERIELFGPLGQRLLEGLQRIFAAWAGFTKIDALNDERAALQQIARELEQRLDARDPSGRSAPRDDQESEDLYSLLGCLRGLIGAMQETQRSIQQINWAQWAEARF